MVYSLIETIHHAWRSAERIVNTPHCWASIGNRSQSRKSVLTVFIALAVYIFFITQTFPDHTSAGIDAQYINTLRSNTNSSSQVFTQDFASGKATLQLEIMRDENNTLVTGQHYASVVIKDKSCQAPSFAIRLVGEALVSIPLVEVDNKHPSSWLGTFTIPVEGDYSVDLRWFGCTGHEIADTSNDALPSPMKFTVFGPPQVEHNYSHTNLFARAFWMSKQSIPSIVSDDRFTDYVWVDPTASVDDENDENIHLKGKNISILKHGTFTDTGMYKFSELGNYEIVCFWGGATMYRVHELFLHEKKIIARGQRPFKFHYYNITRFQNPDRDWDQSDKERCRKCKHIFLSIDDIEPLSQTDFDEQFQTFVFHLQRLMDDSTFPVWILSTSATSSMNREVNCHEPLKYPRSSDHPCNDVLKALFRRQPSPFQDRVHLLDNSDLVMPTLEDDDMKEVVLANIAMRIFVTVGKGVSDWRKVRQEGKSDGLHRNGTIEPNFELIPYDWSEPVSP